MKKLELLGEKFAQTNDKNDPKMRITLLRLRNSQQNTEEKLGDIDQEIFNLDDFLGNEKNTE